MRSSLFSIFLLFFITLTFNGCNNDEKKQLNNPYEKKYSEVSQTEEPSDFRDFALVASGNIEVTKSLTTDGPLADIHANNGIKASTRSLSISGKISSKNNGVDDSSILRSFDYQTYSKPKHSNILRALKVSEFLNNEQLYEYIELHEDGLISLEGEISEEGAIEDNIFKFQDGTWSINGSEVLLTHSVKVNGNLIIDADSTYIAGSLLVQGELKARGELNVNTGSPFNRAIISDNSIHVESLTAIGRLHVSGDFYASSNINIIGNAEIDGDVTLHGDSKISFLDNIYKAALYDMQLNAENDGKSINLVHSQLFRDVNGNNSVVLFTFVEGDYLINENTLFHLIKEDQLSEFTFKTYLYGATIDYASQLYSSDGLSPYYQNKLNIIEQLKNEGTEIVRLTESIDVSPGTLYHTFETSLGKETHRVLSLTSQQPETAILTDDMRQKIKDQLNTPEPSPEEQIADFENEKAEQQSEIEDTTLNPTAEELAEIDQIIAEENQGKTPEEMKQQSEVDRVEEWVTYKELAVDDEVIEIEEILPNSDGVGYLRRWGKFTKVLRKTAKKALRVVTFTDCQKRTNTKFIRGVKDISSTNDAWQKMIALRNSGNYCTPISSAMLLNYHKTGRANLINEKNRHSNLYPVDYENSKDNSRYNAIDNNKYVNKFADYFGTSKSNGTFHFLAYNWIPRVVAFLIYQETNKLTSYWTSAAFLWNREWMHVLAERHINSNNPLLFSAFNSFGKIEKESTENHTMPVIGYKTEYYVGVCWKHILPKKRWLAVDSTWLGDHSNKNPHYNSRGFLRFDMRSNYVKYGALMYIKVW